MDTIYIIESIILHLGHLEDDSQRRCSTKNPELLFWFWWRNTWPKIFGFMIILNYISNSNFTPPGKITWRHHRDLDFLSRIHGLGLYKIRIIMY